MPSVLALSFFFFSTILFADALDIINVDQVIHPGFTNAPMIKAILIGTIEIPMLAQNIANYLYAPRVTIKSQ